MIVNINISGSKEAKQKLRDIQRAGKDMKPYYEDVGRRIVKVFNTVFEREGIPKWKKRKDSLPHPILQKTGRLRRSFTERGAKGNIYKVSSVGLEIGSSLMVDGYNLAYLHHTGTRKMPSRKIISKLVENMIGMIAFGRLVTYWKKVFKK